jgi:hypothetical protein
MFSETRYAMNGNLRVAYRASPEGERDIVLVPAWFSNCEELPEQPPVQGSGAEDFFANWKGRVATPSWPGS